MTFKKGYPGTPPTADIYTYLDGSCHHIALSELVSTAPDPLQRTLSLPLERWIGLLSCLNKLHTAPILH